MAKPPKEPTPKEPTKTNWSLITILVTVLGSGFGLYYAMDARIDALSEKIVAVDARMGRMEQDMQQVKSNTEALMGTTKKLDSHVLIIREVLNIDPSIQDTVGLHIMRDLIAYKRMRERPGRN